jgi:predicted ATPase with chaperone activity
MKVTIETAEVNWTEPQPKHLHEIPGQEAAKRAIEVALASGQETVFLSSVGSPASDLLRATARLARGLGIPFKGRVIPVCPCGAYGNPKVECNCSDDEINDYCRQIMPFLRSAGIIIETVASRASDTTRGNEPETMMTARIVAALARAEPSHYLNDDVEQLVRMAASQLGANREKAVTLAATIACLDQQDRILPQHMAEAIQYQHPASRRLFDQSEEITVGG